MKRFDIITEIDARSLAAGETVELSPRGHITPLAQDTLRARRVIVVREGRVSDADATLAPAAEIRTLAMASDHTGVALRHTLMAYLRGRGLAVQDLGTEGSDRIGDRGQQDRRRAGGDGDLGADRAVFPRAQRRERPDARRHAADAGRGAGDCLDLAEH